MDNNVRLHAVNYMNNKAAADKEKAQLSLELLTESAAGIGDHSTGDYYNNLDEALVGLVDARDRIELLKELYPDLLGG